MKQRPRIYYTEEQKTLMWERWKKGDSLQQIAQLLDRHHTSVHHILAGSGDIRPAPCQRSSRSPTLTEREEISRGLAVDYRRHFDESPHETFSLTNKRLRTV